MSGSRHQAPGRGRCECMACFGYRVAASLFLTAFAVLLLLSVAFRSGQPKPLLIDGHAADRSSR